MNEPQGIDGVKSQTLYEASLLRSDRVVIVGIGVGDAAAAWRYPVQSTGVERFKIRQKGAGPGHLLRIDQLLAAAELSGGDELLNVGDHHRNNGEGLRHAGHFG